MKKYSLIAPEIREILAEGDYADKICEGFSDLHAHEVSMSLEGLESDKIVQVILSFPILRMVEVFEHFDDEDKKDVFLCFSTEIQVNVIAAMSHDERIDLLKILPKDLQVLILKKIGRSEKEDIDLLLTYDEGSVGALVTSAFAAVAEADTVQDALDHLRKDSEEKETIYYIYVVDQDQHLLGLVSLRQLIVAKPYCYIRDLMNTDIIKVCVDDDQTEVAKIIKDYDFLAVPAIDEEGHLVGIVTVDDVVDLVVAEDTEDILNLGAAGKHVPYLSSSSFSAARQRLVWLLILIGVGFISGYVLERYQVVLDAVLPLIFFIPMLCASAGNAGTQSATVVIRELATDGISSHDLGTVWWKEFRIGLLVGLVLGSLAAVRAFIMEPVSATGIKMGLTVGGAMFLVILIATSCGALFPIFFKRMNVDPALMSGPLIASCVDVCCLLAYLELARFIFHL